MKKKYLIMLVLLLLVSCSQESVMMVHKGENQKGRCHIVCMDSLEVTADSISGNGNFYMKDSILTFADMTLCTLFHFDINSGKKYGHCFKKGNGRNEFTSMMYSYPISGTNKYFAMDSSLGIYIYDDKKELIEKKSKINFDWNENVHNFDSPSMYNLMYMSDFGMNISKVNDSTLMIPVSIIDRYLNNITKERYDKGHIFAEVNYRNFKVTRVFGNFPEVYKEKASNVLEFFQYDKVGDTIYTNHSIDSLVYVYKYPDKLLYTMGFDAIGTNHNYPERLTKDHSMFRQDVENLSITTGLKHDHGFLFRTVMLNIKSGETIMQVYSGTNMVGEFYMPHLFKYLGFYKGFFYGVSLVPKQKNDKLYFVRYKFKLVLDEE